MLPISPTGRYRPEGPVLPSINGLWKSTSRPKLIIVRRHTLFLVSPMVARFARTISMLWTEIQLIWILHESACLTIPDQMRGKNCPNHESPEKSPIRAMATFSARVRGLDRDTRYPHRSGIVGCFLPKKRGFSPFMPELLPFYRQFPNFGRTCSA